MIADRRSQRPRSRRPAVDADCRSARRTKVQEVQGDGASGAGGANGAHPAGGVMTDKQIRDEALTLLLAGHETTANALTWTMYLLSQTPVGGRGASRRDRSRACGPCAHRSPISPNSRMPGASSLKRCASTHRRGSWAVEPSMRTRSVNSRFLARGIIFMSPFVTHRDAGSSPIPKRFDPDRWTPEFEASLPKFAYFPFGGGARQCIGEQFAWMEASVGPGHGRRNDGAWRPCPASASSRSRW